MQKASIAPKRAQYISNEPATRTTPGVRFWSRSGICKPDMVSPLSLQSFQSRSCSEYNHAGTLICINQLKHLSFVRKLAGCVDGAVRVTIKCLNLHFFVRGLVVASVARLKGLRGHRNDAARVTTVAHSADEPAPLSS